MEGDIFSQFSAEQLLAAAERKINGIKEQDSNIELVCMDDVEEEKTIWLYPPYIPRGKVSLCAAYPGAGKTYLMCYATACVSTGRQFFDIIPFESKPENAIYITSEDGLGDTIKKRLKECGGDMSKIYSVKDPKAELTFNSPKLETIIKQVNPALLVMDPFQSFIGEDVEMNAANKTRASLNNLVELARIYHTAIVLVCHFNKNNRGDAITRVIGSTDIVGLSRSYIAVGNVPKEQDIKFMSHEKSSLSSRGKTKLFHIDPDNGGIVFDGDSELMMNDYTALRYNNIKKAPSLDAAKIFLLNNIPGKKRLAIELKNLAKANGFSYETLNRARKELNIESKQEGFRGAYYWIKTDKTLCDI
ncbi:MAG: AAA family ATPase [Lachnospiraceae bacterium]|nr:AAA family ATPase [Lachnospiraceae bacterium]